MTDPWIVFLNEQIDQPRRRRGHSSSPAAVPARSRTSRSAAGRPLRRTGRGSTRALREVEAKRAQLKGRDRGVHRCDWREHRGGDFRPCAHVRTMLSVYADQPGYDEEWAP